MPKSFPMLQIRPEDDPSDSAFAAILRHGRRETGDVQRLRIESTGIREAAAAG